VLGKHSHYDRILLLDVAKRETEGVPNVFLGGTVSVCRKDLESKTGFGSFADNSAHIHPILI
jgi:glutaredoxin